MTALLAKIIRNLSNNQGIVTQEKADPLQSVKACLINLQQNNVPINQSLLKTIVERLSESPARQQILTLLDNYRVKPRPALPNKLNLQKQKEEKKQDVSSFVHEELSNNHQHQQQKTMQINNTLDKIDAIQATGPQMNVLAALRKLKKIIQKTQPQEIFTQLYTVFIQNQINQYRDVLGHLLAEFYPNRPKQSQKKVLSLLLRKDKTGLSKQSCYDLLRVQKQAFLLSKRWRLQGREWLDLAMIRFQEGFYELGCQVAQYNLVQQSQLSYFYGKNYQKICVQYAKQLATEEQLIQFLLLLGTSARFAQTKVFYTQNGFHVKIMKLSFEHLSNNKVLANLCYALSSMSFTQPQVCLEIVKQSQQIQIMLLQLGQNSNNRSVVESGSCLVANLAYANQQVKNILRQLNICSILVGILADNCETAQQADLSMLKQLFRAFGNLSLSKLFSKEMIDQHFLDLAVAVMDRLEVLQKIDDKNIALTVTVIDVVANLTSHGYRLEVFHQQQMTYLIVQIMKISQKNPQILMSCIDAIDCLCQNSQIQNFMVMENKIPVLLVSNLKLHKNFKAIVKSIRLVTNLTINANNHRLLIETGVLNIVAGSVFPQLFTDKVSAQQSKKILNYVNKIVTRVYQSKLPSQLLVKSGYLDCVIKLCESQDTIEDSYIQILYQFSPNIPKELNKNVFIALIKALNKKIHSQAAVNRCLSALKKMPMNYLKDQPDFELVGMPQMYLHLLSGTLKDDALFLLAFHLLRSHKLRKQVLATQNLMNFLTNLGKQPKYFERYHEICFILNNPSSGFQGLLTCSKNLKELKEITKPMTCNLYRIDGTMKKALIEVSQSCKVRAYKYPQGQIKEKYSIDLELIRDCQFTYKQGEPVWIASVFKKSTGSFDLTASVYQACASIVGVNKWGDFGFINVEFDSESDKKDFYLWLGQLLSL